MASRVGGVPDYMWRQKDGFSWWNPAKPPPIPAGFVTAAPDFVGVGAEKAGTSWWYTLITSHSSVHDPAGRPKELHFFDQFWQRPMEELDVDLYSAYFPRPAGQLAGEWTPRYMLDYWVPPMLRVAAPAARILVLLRDPLDRYLSGVTQDLRINSLFMPHVADIAAARSLYYRQLSTVLENFPREQVLVLQYERCVRETETELARTFAFLGLDDERGSIDIHQRVNETHGEGAALTPARERALLDYFEPDVSKLVELLGADIDPALWQTCAKLGLA